MLLIVCQNCGDWFINARYMTQNYLESATKQFEYYKMLGDKTISQLSDEQLFVQMNAESNSIATVVKHLWGNMMSRWTDFLSTDGEKDWRQRDAEFENDLATRADVHEKWEEGWRCLFKALSVLTEADFNRTVYIRNQGHTVVDAINRQLCHYANHVGQMAYLGKMMQNEQWQSLSIPKGQSTGYNANKFAQPKSQQHFTDEYLEKK